jgi:hypothetical protein
MISWCNPFWGASVSNLKKAGEMQYINWNFIRDSVKGSIYRQDLGLKWTRMHSECTHIALGMYSYALGMYFVQMPGTWQQIRAKHKSTRMHSECTIIHIALGMYFDQMPDTWQQIKAKHKFTRIHSECTHIALGMYSLVLFKKIIYCTFKHLFFKKYVFNLLQYINYS